MASPNVLKVAPTDTGCCIRVEGKGTMKESQAVSDLVARTLGADERAVVLLDLTACDYLDSTFLGSLMQMYRQYGKSGTPRCLVLADQERRTKLMGPLKIDRLIPAQDTAPALRGEWRVLDANSRNQRELMQHVMECHRSLAEVPGPMQAAFAKIAEQMEQDLGHGR